MKAIVLTCDRYHEITNHMLKTYQELWTTNNLIFRIPWNNNFPKFIADEWGDKVEFVKTPVEFKPTIEGLLSDIEDDEWIYWATDDSYLVEINQQAADLVREFVEVNTNDNIWSVIFYNGQYDISHRTVNFNEYLQYKGLKLCHKNKITYQWQHQFCRSKVIKTMFDCLDEPEFPKQMDHMQKEEKSKSFWNLIEKGMWLVTENNSVVMAEPTTRGKLTKNGYESFKNYGLEIPSQFEVSDVRITKR